MMNDALRTVLLGMTLALAGCAAPGSHTSREAAQCAPLEQEQQLAIQLARDMADQGRLHAALAHLEQLPGNLPDVRLQKATILRRLEHPDAYALYTSLLNGCVAAEAYHGLGQIEAVNGRYDQARVHMQKAASLNPSSFTIRNDLGFVYLQHRELDKAQFEFMTALELSHDDALPMENLLTLLLYQGKQQEYNVLLREGRATALQYQRADARARRLKQEDEQAYPPINSNAEQGGV
ncbi:tetratricopeptide repeat protein [Halomonas aquamarina]|uniref:Tetratricopeptide repeat protein n=1 Tax=Vreelandella aquamarina TaxID=77097 RepID=A0ACC5VSV2_9GAMM|nr:tetratricopeptide repeat protein [Halomonas aquamarina]MBZ5487045.1 tetratricopeptide repeat protein [Halomonas aquamarina]